MALPTPWAGTKSASTRRSAAPPPRKESPRARTSWLYPPGAATKSASARLSSAPPKVRNLLVHVRRGSTPPGPPLNLQALAGPLPHTQVRHLLMPLRVGSSPPGAATKSASARRSAAAPPKYGIFSRTYVVALPSPSPGPPLNLQALGGQLPHPQCKESPRARTSWLYRRPRGRH